MSKDVQTTLPGIHYAQYENAKEQEYLPQIRQLISKDLSEPYSIYVYRYFLYQWAELCFMVHRSRPHHPSILTILQALDEKNILAGVIICKLEPHRGGPMRGYIAMLATKEEHRGKGIATTLVSNAIDAMIERDADEVALETEETNKAAMKLYERLGFLRSKKLHRYYLNGNDAYRLVLYLKEGVSAIPLEPYEQVPEELPSSTQGSEGEEPGEQDEADPRSRGIV
jgi:N-alpha-acetyltransferase 30